MVCARRAVFLLRTTPTIHRTLENREFTMNKTVAALLLSLAATAPVHAAEFSVGRYDVTLPAGQWQALDVKDDGVTYGGDRSGTFKTASKLYVKLSAEGVVEALVLARANSNGFDSGSATMSYSPKCESDEGVFRDGNTGTKVPYSQCLQVLRPYLAADLLQQVSPEALSALQAKSLALPKGMFMVRNRHAISNGSFLDMTAFFARPVAGPADAAATKLPEGVPPSNVAWGQQLKAAVKSGVGSVFGGFELPAFELVAPDTEAPKKGG